MALPLEEGWPRCPVRVEAPHAVLGRWHVEHHDAGVVSIEHSVEVADMDRGSPPLDQLANVVLTTRCGRHMNADFVDRRNSSPRTHLDQVTCAVVEPAFKDTTPRAVPPRLSGTLLGPTTVPCSSR